MNPIDLPQLLSSILPALIVGAVAFYFFYSHSKDEERRRRFLLYRENQKTSLPIRLQAYERMTLFLERISPGKLLFRIQPNETEVEVYVSLLIQSIEQEFEHNLVQQIYITPDCWDYIKTSKNATIALIRKVSQQEKVKNAEELREAILTALIERPAPTEAALAFVKKEVKAII